MSTLSAAVGNQAALRAELRAVVGYSTDSVLFPDALADSCLRRALERINGMKPSYGVGSLTTILNVQTYAPLPAGARRLMKAWYREEGCSPTVLRHWNELALQLDSLLGNVIDDFGTRLSVEPGAIQILLRNASWLNKWLGSKAVVAELNGSWTIRLIPSPAAGERVYFLYSLDRYATVGAVKTMDAEVFWMAAEIMAHRALAAGAGGITDVRDGSEQSEIRTKAPEHHLALAERRENDFRRAFPPPVLPGFLAGPSAR